METYSLLFDHKEMQLDVFRLLASKESYFVTCLYETELQIIVQVMINCVIKPTAPA